MDVAGVLAQIRALGAQASASPSPKASTTEAASGSFETLFRQVIDRTDASQADATRLQKSFELGDPNTNLSSVMLATAKAQVSFRALVETRNRLVSAYQDVMNMTI